MKMPGGKVPRRPRQRKKRIKSHKIELGEVEGAKGKPLIGPQGEPHFLEKLPIESGRVPAEYVEAASRYLLSQTMGKNVIGIRIMKKSAGSRLEAIAEKFCRTKRFSKRERQPLRKMVENGEINPLFR